MLKNDQFQLYPKYIALVSPIHPAFVQCDIACVLYRVSLFADFNPAIIYYYFMERGIGRGVDHYYRKSSMARYKARPPKNELCLFISTLYNFT